MSSTIGGTEYVLLNDSWSFNPSSKKRLLRFVWPLIDGKEKLPIGLPWNCAFDPFWVVFTVLTPGVRFSNCVKFRPFSGRSLTERLSITEPSSELEVCKPTS